MAHAADNPDTAAGAHAISDRTTASILSSVATAAYEWSIPNDRLSWSDTVRSVLPDVCEGDLASGRAYAHLTRPGPRGGRFEAVVNCAERDTGTGVPYQIEYPVMLPSGTLVWVEDTGRWFGSSDGRPLKAHGVVRVITDRYERDQRLSEASEIDPLTGQMARFRFTSVLNEAVTDAIKVRGSVGLLLASIDNMSRINEAYGFEVADEVIALVGQRLRSRMRGGDLLGRLSGSKFGILVRNCQAEELSLCAERMGSGIAQEVFATSVGPVVLSISIGGAAAPRHARDHEQLLARAQEVLDGVRKSRRGSFGIYAPSPEREAIRRENIQVTDEIIAALNDRRIGLAFQPIVSAAPGRDVSSYECLLRIRRADGSLLPASSIVPIAERLGLVRMIDHRVLELTLAELQSAPDVHLSVNVSPATTMDREWISLLASGLRANPGLAGRLMVEITESSAIANIEETRQFVARVKDLGATVAIDDFGAGYTSFRNLRRLGVDCVKIDGAFVENFDRSDDDRHFVETLLGLARHMNLRTVAEWVQNDQVAARLAELGCDFLQGKLTGSASEARPWIGTDAIEKPARWG